MYKIVFVKTKENNDEIMTRKLANELYQVHGSKLKWTVMMKEYHEKNNVK